MLRWSSSRLQRLTNCTLVPRYCFHPHGLSPPRVNLVPSNDLCRRVVGCVCSWRSLTKTNACPVEPYFLETSRSACLVLLHQVGARVKLTLRRCHCTEFSVIHRRVFFSLQGQPNETSVSLGHVQDQPLAEARWVPAYDPEAGP